MQPPLNPDVAMSLMERYPGVKREGLVSMHCMAWSWIEDQVRPQYMMPGCMPAVFESAAILRIQSMCVGNNRTAKQALRYAATELLMPYRNNA